MSKLHSMSTRHSMSMLHVHVYVHAHICSNAGVLDCLVPDWKKLTMPEQVRYRTKLTQSGIFLVWYRTKIRDAGMPMPPLVSSMLMPSYDFYGISYHISLNMIIWAWCIKKSQEEQEDKNYFWIHLELSHLEKSSIFHLWRFPVVRNLLDASTVLTWCLWYPNNSRVDNAASSSTYQDLSGNAADQGRGAQVQGGLTEKCLPGIHTFPCHAIIICVC
jgi:hypothetical protein